MRIREVDDDGPMHDDDATQRLIELAVSAGARTAVTALVEAVPKMFGGESGEPAFQQPMGGPGRAMGSLALAVSLCTAIAATGLAFYSFFTSHEAVSELRDKVEVNSRAIDMLDRSAQRRWEFEERAWSYTWDRLGLEESGRPDLDAVEADADERPGAVERARRAASSGS